MLLINKNLVLFILINKLYSFTNGHYIANNFLNVHLVVVVNDILLLVNDKLLFLLLLSNKLLLLLLSNKLLLLSATLSVFLSVYISNTYKSFKYLLVYIFLPPYIIRLF